MFPWLKFSTRGRGISLLHSRSGTSLQNVRFRKRQIMLDTYTRPRGRCFLVSIKVQNVHFQAKIFGDHTSWRPYKKDNFGSWGSLHFVRSNFSRLPLAFTVFFFCCCYHILVNIHFNSVVRSPKSTFRNPTVRLSAIVE